MITFIEKKRKNLPFRILSAFIAFTFSLSVITPPQSYAQTALPLPILLDLPSPGTMVPVSSGFIPPMIKGITIHPENPLLFDFIVDTGDEKLQGTSLKEESEKLIKYFLASLTVPEEEMWVNLSPYEKDRIVPQGFGDTEMGRDLLTQDYLLKQLTASLMYPEDELGKKFWDRVYTKAYEMYGTTEIPMNTFNKIWIVPENATVFEKDASAFVVESHLKVMLEEDYVALSHQPSAIRSQLKAESRKLRAEQSEVIRKILIPEIEKEVNEGQTFANLRQIFNSMILAVWYKQNLKESLLGQVYVDKNKTKGVDTQDKAINQKIYNQYVEAFKKGVYNYIREDYDPATQRTTPRKYFSGGVNPGEFFLREGVSVIKEGLDSGHRERLQGSGGDVLVTSVNVEIPSGVDAEIVAELLEIPTPVTALAQAAASSPITEFEKPIYFFGRDLKGGNITEGTAKMRWELGGKGANLAGMANLGIPVPPGFTLTTKVAEEYLQSGKRELSAEVKADIDRALEVLEKATGRKLGDTEGMPLVVSVRSGARVSMPGMMDTVLNAGTHDKTVLSLGKAFGDGRFAWDTYRRFIGMYGESVLGLKDENPFGKILDEKKKERGLTADRELTEADLRDIVEKFKAYIKSRGEKLPQHPDSREQAKLQVYEAVMAVFDSYNSERAKETRRIKNIPSDTFSAVNIQAMVYGNLNDNSATGVAFTRDPATGQNVFFGEYLINAQGEDVVAGVRTPMPINSDGIETFLAAHPDYEGEVITLEEAMPDVYVQLQQTFEALETYYEDMQDTEFTIENGKLWLLQTRNGERNIRAALKIAVDMVAEGIIDEKEAVLRVNTADLDTLFHDMFEKEARQQAVAEGRIIAKGLPAGPGQVSGVAVFTAERAVELRRLGKKVILVRKETDPDDFLGMVAAEGILTERGGMTSHAAVVGRGMGKTVVAGASMIEVHEEERYFTVGNTTIREGDPISLDGSTGEVFAEKIATMPSVIIRGLQGEQLEGDDKELFDNYNTFMGWVNEYRSKVRTNAETPEDVAMAVKFGADGIGLVRTEHMFFEDSEEGQDRRFKLRKMILSGNIQDIAQLGEFQKEDFKEILRILHGLPATIRLMDPPFHEFLPDPDDDKNQEVIERLAQAFDQSFPEIVARINAEKPVNPMAGLRGNRLGILFPEIFAMQYRAIFDAVTELKKERVKVSPPEIMIPLVNGVAEFVVSAEEIETIAWREYKLIRGKDYYIGTMIETVGAALDADKLAEVADFFSFGSNDLHQFTFFFSRDDAGAIVIPRYRELGILKRDPFVTIDPVVAELMQIAAAKARGVKPDMSMGCCGEQGGDPISVAESLVPVDIYPSASPYRIPVAQLASAQTNIRLARLKAEGKGVPEYDLSKITNLDPVKIGASHVHRTEALMRSDRAIRGFTRAIVEKDSSAIEIVLPAAISLLGERLEPGFFKILEKDQNALIRLLNLDLDTLLGEKTQEANPSLGNLGARQALTGYDGIYRAQLKGLFRAMGNDPLYDGHVRIIVPLVVDVEEFLRIKKMVHEVAKEEGIDSTWFHLGAGISTPRAALRAGEFAKVADFLAIDTMILTEAVLAMTREDAPPIVKVFRERGIYEEDPFEFLGSKVIELIEIANKRVKDENPEIPIILFGENAKFAPWTEAASSPISISDVARENSVTGPIVQAFESSYREMREGIRLFSNTAGVSEEDIRQELDQKIYGPLFNALNEIADLVDSKKIDPSIKVRVSRNDQEQEPREGRPLRVAYLPMKGDPWQVGHLFVILEAIAKFQLDKVVIGIDNSDPVRKPGLSSLAVREPVTQAVLQEMLGNLVQYTPIAREEEKLFAADGETMIFFLMSLNRDQRIDWHYMAGSDHRYWDIKKNHPETGEEIILPDVAHKFFQKMKESLDGFQIGGNHRVNLILSERPGEPVTEEEMRVLAEKAGIGVGKIIQPMDTSSTRVREQGHYWTVPVGVYEYAQYLRTWGFDSEESRSQQETIVTRLETRVDSRLDLESQLSYGQQDDRGREARARINEAIKRDLSDLKSHGIDQFDSYLMKKIANSIGDKEWLNELRTLVFERGHEIVNTASSPVSSRQIALDRLKKVNVSLGGWTATEILESIMAIIRDEELEISPHELSFQVNQDDGGLSVIGPYREFEDQLFVTFRRGVVPSFLGAIDVKRIAASDATGRRKYLRSIAQNAKQDSGRIVDGLTYTQPRASYTAGTERDVFSAQAEETFLDPYRERANDAKENYKELYDLLLAIQRGEATQLVLTKELVEKWKVKENLVNVLLDLARKATAGMRETQNPLNPADLSYAMNMLLTLLTANELAEMALDQAEKEGNTDPQTVIGGEVRYNTPLINSMLRQRLAAMGFTVHSPKAGDHLPIGATSFITTLENILVTFYDTASHAARFIYATKVMGFTTPKLSKLERLMLKSLGEEDITKFERSTSEGAQLLIDEMVKLAEGVAAKVEHVLESGEPLILDFASAKDSNIQLDLDNPQHPDNKDVSGLYAEYLEGSYINGAAQGQMREALDGGLRYGYEQANGSASEFNRRVLQHLLGKSSDKIEWASVHPDSFFGGTGMGLYNPKGNKYGSVRAYVDANWEALNKFFVNQSQGFVLTATLSDSETLEQIKAEIRELNEAKELTDAQRNKENQLLENARSLRFQVLPAEAENPIVKAKGMPYKKLSNGNLLVFYEPSLFDYSQDVSLLEVVMNSGLPAILKDKPIGYIDATTDPDGDRYVVMQVEANTQETQERLKRLNIAFLILSDDKLLTVFTPNQNFFDIQGSLINTLMERGEFRQHLDGFDEYEEVTFFGISTTVSTSLWRDLWNKFKVPTVLVPVGFKEISRMERIIEEQIRLNELRVKMGLRKQRVIVHDVFGKPIDLGYNPRLLFAGEESGGMVVGKATLLESSDGSRQFLGWREKNAVEANALMLKMVSERFNAARDAVDPDLTGDELYQNEDFLARMSLSRQFEAAVEAQGSRNTAELRTDYTLMNLMAVNRMAQADAQAYKRNANDRRDHNDAFFIGLSFALQDGDITSDDVKDILKDAFQNSPEIRRELVTIAGDADHTEQQLIDDLTDWFDAELQEFYFQGDGVFMGFKSGGYAIIRPSGTDPKMKGYPSTSSEYISKLISNAIVVFNPKAHTPQLWQEILTAKGRTDMLDVVTVLKRKETQYERGLDVDTRVAWDNEVGDVLTQQFGEVTNLGVSNVTVRLGPRDQRENLRYVKDSNILYVNWDFDQRMQDSLRAGEFDPEAFSFEFDSMTTPENYGRLAAASPVTVDLKINLWHGTWTIPYETDKATAENLSSEKSLRNQLITIDNYFIQRFDNSIFDFLLERFDGEFNGQFWGWVLKNYPQSDAAQVIKQVLQFNAKVFATLARETNKGRMMSHEGQIRPIQDWTNIRTLEVGGGISNDVNIRSILKEALEGEGFEVIFIRSDQISSEEAGILGATMFVPSNERARQVVVGVDVGANSAKIRAIQFDIDGNFVEFVGDFIRLDLDSTQGTDVYYTAIKTEVDRLKVSLREEDYTVSLYTGVGHPGKREDDGTIAIGTNPNLGSNKGDFEGINLAEYLEGTSGDTVVWGNDALAQALAGYQLGDRKVINTQVMYVGPGGGLGVAFFETGSEGEVTRFRDAHIQHDPSFGEYLAASSPVADRTVHHDADGEITGTSIVHSDGRTVHHDADGKITGTSRVSSDGRTVHQDADGKITGRSIVLSDGQTVHQDADDKITGRSIVHSDGQTVHHDADGEITGRSIVLSDGRTVHQDADGKIIGTSVRSSASSPIRAIEAPRFARTQTVTGKIINYDPDQISVDELHSFIYRSTLTDEQIEKIRYVEVVPEDLLPWREIVLSNEGAVLLIREDIKNVPDWVREEGLLVLEKSRLQIAKAYEASMRRKAEEFLLIRKNDTDEEIVRSAKVLVAQNPDFVRFLREKVQRALGFKEHAITRIVAHETVPLGGNPTIEVEVSFLVNGQKTGVTVPSGALTNEFGAWENDGNSHYFDRQGVFKAIGIFNKVIAPKLIRLNILDAGIPAHADYEMSGILGAALAVVRSKALKGDTEAGSSPITRNGGINLNPALLDLQIKRDKNGIPLPVMQQPIGEMQIEGFLPVIINITPINLPQLLGFAPPPAGLADGEFPADTADTDSKITPLEIGFVDKYRNKYIRQNQNFPA